MLSDILNIFKFITDSSTRETIQSIARIASERQVDWKKNVFSMKGEFRLSDWFKINAFTNELFRRVRETGISDSKYDRFTTVYTELVENAYHHGCNKKKRCKVKISCIFSKWFIQLEVADTGKGFSISDIEERIRQEKRTESRIGLKKTGLEVVLELSDNLEIKKKSRVIVVIAGENRVKIHETIEKAEGKNILVVTVEEDSQWSFLYPSWEPLRDALERTEEPLILVRFGRLKVEDTSPVVPQKKFVPDNSSLRITKRARQALPVILECALNRNSLYAYVLSDRWVYDNFSEFETENLHFFRNESNAKAWLLNPEKNFQEKNLNLPKSPFEYNDTYEDVF